MGSLKFQAILSRLCGGANYPTTVGNGGTKYCPKNEPIIKIEPINRWAVYPVSTVLPYQETYFEWRAAWMC